MSKTVDERVVSMQFDNKHFENNVQTSIGTLDRLKRSLNFSGASKSLEGINTAAKKCDMGPLASGVESVHMKFSALQVMATTALANITNSAVNAGKRIASSLTIEPIRTGLAEYETQINAVQTILANTQSKGTTLTDVNKALDELNLYADKTIYNFSEMTRNIGTFTAAGVDLDTSVSAIKGIANLAAMSGSSSQQASTAMYQLSQALATGRVTLMDWNSVVNAGMGGEVMQNALKETARAHGVAVDDIIKKYGSFRDSLTQGDWLTSDILLETLQKFTGDLSEAQLKSMGYTEAQIKDIMKLGQTANDAATKVKTFSQLMETLKETAQSGWAQTWEILIGDFEEAKKLWTGASDLFGGYLESSAKARNELLKGWADGGGRTMAIESLKNVFEGLLSILRPIKEAFREIFPPMTAERLLKITESIRDLTAKFKLSDEQAANLKSTFKGLFSIISFGFDIIKQVVGGIAKIFGSLLGFGNGLLEFTGGIGEFITNMRNGVKESNMFGNAINAVVGFITRGIEAIKNFGGPALKGFWNVLKTIASKVAEVASTIFKALGDAFKSGDINAFMDVFNNGLLAVILLKIKGFITNFSKKMGGFSAIVDALKKGLGSITGVLDAVRGSLQAWVTNIKVGILLKIATALAILTASLVVLASMDKAKLETSLGAITILFMELVAAMRILTAGRIDGAFGKMTVMLGMATAVLILAGALKKLASMDMKELLKGVLGLAGIMAILTASIRVMSNGSGKAIKGATNIVIFAAAIKILASVCKDMASMSWEEIAKGLVGVGALMAEIDIFLNTAKFSGKSMLTATGIVILAAAIKILESSCKTFAAMSWEEIGKGVSAIGIILGELAAFSKITGTAKHTISSGISINLMALALKNIAEVFADLSKMSWEGIGKAVAAMTFAFAAIVAALKLMPNDDLFVSMTFSGAVSALLILANAFEIFDKISLMGVLGGIAAISATLAALTAAMKLMHGTTKASLSLIVAASALYVLAGAIAIIGNSGIMGAAIALGAFAGIFTVLGLATLILKPLIPSIFALSGAIATLSLSFITLGVGIAAIGAGLTTFIAGLVTSLLSLQLLGWGAIIKGLVTVAAAFAIVGIAAAVLKPLNGAIITLAGSIALFGLSCAAIGLGVSLIASGLATLAMIGEEGAKTIGVALKSIIQGIAESIPLVIKKIGEGLVELIKVIGDSALAIADALKKIVLAVVDMLVTCIPTIAEGALKLIVGVLDALARYTPQIVDLLFDFLVGLLEGVAKNIPRLVDAAVKVIMSFFTSVFDALAGQDWSVLGKALAGMGIMTALLLALSAMAALVPSAMIGVLGVGAVITELALVVAALGALEQIPGLSWLIKEGGEFLQNLGNAIGKMVGGFVGGILEGVADSLPEIAKSLSEFMENLKPFLTGAQNITPESMEGVQALAGVILTLTATSVLDGLTRWLTGGSSLSRFAKEIVPFGEGLKAYSQAVSGIDPDVIKDSAVAAEALSTLAKNLPNSGGLLGLLAGNNDIGDFGIQLIPFGEGMKAYSKAINGIDSGLIKESAVAGTALAELAETLPNSGGLLGLLVGNNDIGDFGLKLVPFGEGMKAYADAISGIDTKLVSESATAAESLVELADKLPKTGGLLSWITGESNLALFGEQLVPFANGMKEYSYAISGIDNDAVTASAAAATALAELAKNLPNEGGLVSWFAGDNNIGKFGDSLVDFGDGMKDYAEAISGIDNDAVKSSATAAKALAELAKNLPNEGGLVSWFTGDNSLSNFADDLEDFGKGMKKYSDSISGINPETVTASANAASAISELAKNLPNEGGAISWIVGDNKLSDFAEHLEPFGKAMKDFSMAIVGVDPDVVEASANAAKALSEVAKNLPNEGGAVSWFVGDNKLSDFADHLEPFGEAMKKYSDKVKGIKPEAVESSANAAKAFSECAKNLSECKDVNMENISNFAEKIVPFGEAMKSYADALGDGFDSKKVESSANAAMALAELAKNLPSDDGIMAKLVGVRSLVEFGDEIVEFGSSMKAYSDALGDNFSAKNVEASANAAETLSALAKNLPIDDNSFMGLFSKQQTLTSFAEQLKPFGEAMAAYSTALGKNFNSDAVIASANAGTAISELAKNLPSDPGTLNKLFSEKNSLKTFAEQLKPFGEAMAAYSKTLSDGNFNADTVTKSATAAKTLADIVNTLQSCNVSIISTLFGGEDGVAVFVGQLKTLGNGMKEYGVAVAGIADKEKDVTVSSSVAKTLAGVAQTLSGMSGLSDAFKSETITNLATQLSTFGQGMKDYGDDVTGLADKEKDITASANAAKNMKSVATSISGCDGIIPEDFNTNTFVSKLKAFAQGMKDYATTLGSGFDSGAIEKSAGAAKKLTTAINGMAGINTSGVTAFTEAINTLGTAKVAEFVKAFEGAAGKMNKVGVDLIDKFVSGVNSKKDSASKAADTIANSLTQAFTNKSKDFTTSGTEAVDKITAGVDAGKKNAIAAFANLAKECISALRDYYTDFSTVGAYLVDGFAAGISANTWKAEAKARAMANAAKQGAKAELDEHSPSKEFYKIGDFAGLGFVNALGDYAKKSYNAGANIASYAREGLTNVASSVMDFINSDIDTQPTIRPVLDLSNISEGVGRINGMFDNPSIDVMSNIGAISSMMSNRQNGSNNDDVVMAIKSLGSKLGSTGGDTYNINGITYDDGTNVSSAVETLVRAARVERRR